MLHPVVEVFCIRLGVTTSPAVSIAVVLRRVEVGVARLRLRHHEDQAVEASRVADHDEQVDPEIVFRVADDAEAQALEPGLDE